MSCIVVAVYPSGYLRLRKTNQMLFFSNSQELINLDQIKTKKIDEKTLHNHKILNITNLLDLPEDILSKIIDYASEYNNINNDHDIIDHYKQLLQIKLSCKHFFINDIFSNISLFKVVYNKRFKTNNPFPLKNNNHFICCLSCSSYTNQIYYDINPYHDLYCSYCFDKYYIRSK